MLRTLLQAVGLLGSPATGDEQYRHEDDENQPPQIGGIRPLISRSGRWPATRRAHLLLEPECQVCGSKEHLQVHHVKPVHLHPDLELEQSNLITLCEHPTGIGCHCLIGHLCRWKSFNLNVREDAAHLRDKIKNRPE